MKANTDTRQFREGLKVRAGPCGIHIFNRTTGANILLEEVQVPARMWATAPRQISVALTNSCDLRCPYCYAPKNNSVLDSMRLIEWLNELDLNGCLGVGFGGGEPTLHPELASLCHYTTQYTGLAVTFTTHAHKLNDRIAADLKGNVHFIRVSMDGVGATYETLRGRAFSSLCHKLDIVRALAPFGINFVVNSSTIAELDIAVGFAAEMGATEFLLLPERPVHGRPGIDTRTIEQLQTWLNSYAGTIPLRISESGAGKLAACVDPLSRETGLRAYAHIDASGVLKRSSYDESGVLIDAGGVMNALKVLELTTGDKL